MMHKLTFDKEDPNYILLNEIFKIIGSRESKQIMARNGFNNVNELLIIIKTILLAIYFETSITYVVGELESNLKLREGLKIDYVVSSDKIYNRISRLDPDKLQNTVNSILNKFINNNRRGVRSFIIDATPSDLNINFGSKKVSKKSLENKDYAWAWGTAIGYYIGYKVTLVLDYRTKMPVYFMIDRGSPSDTKMIARILPILQRKRIIRRGNRILFDRGYYSYENYKIALQKYHVIPLILVKENFNKSKLEDILSYPLDIYKHKKSDLKKAKIQYEALVRKLLEYLEKPKKIKYHRGFIEDFFKIMKIGLGFKKLNRFTHNSMHKFTSLTVLLAGLIVHLCVKKKGDFQKLAEGTLW